MLLPYAISMAPLDWGLCGAAVLLVVFAVRSLVTGEGKSQMGCGFMFVAAAVGTFAVGRQVEGFTTEDGARLTLGVLLLMPVFRVLFTKSGSSVTVAVTSLLLSSVIAGPIVARAFPEHVKTDVPLELTKVRTEIERVDASIEATRSTRDSIVASAANARTAFDALGIESAEELEASAEALATWETYKRFRDEMDALGKELDSLTEQRASLESSLTALEAGGDHRAGLDRANEIRSRIEESVTRRSLKSDAERYADRAELLEFFEAEAER